jgi:cytochrome c553
MPKNLITIGLVGILLFSLVMEPASAAGDPVRGKQLSEQCFACHGMHGMSPSPVIPKIGGQHEAYLLLALKAYVNGGRPDSLMSGAVLDKSEQDLEDMAAYFSSQSGAAGGGAGSAGPGGPRGPGGPGGPGGRRGAGGSGMKIDHGDRDSGYVSMLARARALFTVQTAKPDEALCLTFASELPLYRDDDKDGLPNRYDAAPNDADEFAADLNEDGRYEICNIHQLQAISTLGSGGDSKTSLSIEARRARGYQVVRDLDAKGLDFEPIGDCGPTGNCMKALGEFGFSGVLDGRGYTIRNLTISKKERGGVGLVGVLAASGVVMNLNLQTVTVAGRAGVGSVVGSNFGTVYNCRANGSVEGAMAIGGLVGGSAGLVFDSWFAGSVSGKQAVGGLVGDMTGAVYQSSTSVEVSADRGVGGLVGLSTFGSILDSYADANVAGGNDVGGLVGVNTDAKVRNSYSVGTVIGESNNIGGLVGFNSQSSVRNSYAISEVSGVEAVGGLVGRNNGVVENSFAAGMASGSGQIGSLIGFAVVEQVSRSFSTGVDPLHPDAQTDLAQLDGVSTGWAPAEIPVTKPLNYFCDLNRNGFIDPAESIAENYIWEFGSVGEMPAVRCVAGGIEKQRT